MLKRCQPADCMYNVVTLVPAYLLAVLILSGG